MKSEEKFELKNFLYTIIFGFLFSIIIGVIFFQTNIFSYYSRSFVFISFGLTGAIIFAALKYRNLQDSILLAAILFIINFIIYSQHSFKFALRDILEFTAIWLSMYLYKIWFIPKMEDKKYIRALGLGAIYAGINVLAGIVVMTLFILLYDLRIHVFPLLFSYLQVGMLVGLGLGIGFDVVEGLSHKFQKSIFPKT